MKNDRNNIRKAQIPQLKRASSENNGQLNMLRAQLRALTETAQQKRNQLLDINARLRSEGVKNQKLKKQVVEAQKKTNELISNQVQYLFSKYKNNKQSPLFYNQNGLSPFQLLRIGQYKFDQIQEKLICMVCYTDLEKGVKIMRLPCSHFVHKQCGIQHLLYSKSCPACNQDLK